MPATLGCHAVMLLLSTTLCSQRLPPDTPSHPSSRQFHELRKMHKYTQKARKTSFVVLRRDALPLRGKALCVLVAQLPLLICAMGNLGGKVRRESLGKTFRAAKLKGFGVSV